VITTNEEEATAIMYNPMPTMMPQGEAMKRISSRSREATEKAVFKSHRLLRPKTVEVAEVAID
jgi:hypothetical protein